MAWHTHPAWLHRVLAQPWCPRPVELVTWRVRMALAGPFLRQARGYMVRRCPRCGAYR